MMSFLIESDWITPQLKLLLELQHFRDLLPNFINELFLSITTVGEFFLPTLVGLIIFWCINSKKGISLLFLIFMNIFVSQFLKMLACVYRPWVLDNRITPLPKALLHSGGYSFPSGHTTMATSFCGGLVYLFNKYKLVSFSLVFLILLVGFSRMYLGVHTPQDILTGLIIGVVLVFIFPKYVDYLEEKRTRYLWFILGFNFSIALIFLVILNKSYPIDYVNGKVLVEPLKAIYNSIVCYGLTIGLANGLALSRLLNPFDAKSGTKLTKIFRAIIGAIIYYLLFQYIIQRYCFAAMHDFKLTIILTSFVGFAVTFIYPLVFTRIEKKVFHDNI